MQSGFVLFSKFDDPARPQEDLLRDSIADFTHAIDKTLKTDCHKSTVIRIRFHHDILRFLFNHKNLGRLQLEDFDTEFFPYGWNQRLQQYHGESGEAEYYGRGIDFPIKIEPYLNWTRWFCNHA